MNPEILEHKVPNELMERLPMLKEAAKPLIDYYRSFYQRASNRCQPIEIDRILRCDVILVGRACPHTDPDFGWTALWPIVPAGQTLYSGNRIRKPTVTVSSEMHEDTLLLLDTRLPHWTDHGKGVLACINIEHDHKPGDDPRDLFAKTVKRLLKQTVPLG